MAKSVVEVTPAEWLAFKGLAAERGVSIQELLGRLVRREVRAAVTARAKQAARSKHFANELARLERSGG
jgi:hypothetical protein